MGKQVTNDFPYFIYCLTCQTFAARAIEIIDKALKHSKFKAIVSRSPNQEEKDVKKKQMIDVQGIIRLKKGKIRQDKTFQSAKVE